MRSALKVAVGAVSLFVAHAPSLSAAPVPWAWWEGAWAGTIGSHPVHVCLTEGGWRGRQGAYYYDRSKVLIGLAPGTSGERWVEGDDPGKDAPQWLVKPNGAQLSGTWRHGADTLPIRLHRIRRAAEDDQGPCGSTAFQRPRVAGARIRPAPFTKDGERLTRWTFKPDPPFKEVEFSTFTLNRPGAGIAKVNRVLRSVLPNADGTGEWLDCVSGNVTAQGRDGTYTETMEPVFITRRWLSIRHTTSYYCGGAHPEYSDSLRTFDLLSGDEPDLEGWFSPVAIRIDKSGRWGPSTSFTPEFRAIILAGWKPDDPECEEVVPKHGYWSIGVERGALVFTPDLARIVSACREDFKIPLAKLQPWLNAEGKAAVATLPR